MNVAIPLFKTRVSPRFDCAQVVLLLQRSADRWVNRCEIAFYGLAPHERINRLVELGVDTLICGGIDRWSAESLQSAGVKIYAFITGEVEDALARLLDGRLGGIDPLATMDADVAGRCGRPRRGRCMNRGAGGRNAGNGPMPAPDDVQQFRRGRPGRRGRG